MSKRAYVPAISCAAFLTALVSACSSTVHVPGENDGGGEDGIDGGSGDGAATDGGTRGEPGSPCADATECLLGPRDPECAAPACNQGTCGFTFTPKGTPSSAQTPGDCRKRVCDGAGALEDAPDETDAPPQVKGDCRTTQCDASGNVTQVADDSDIPQEQNQCAPSTCKSGAVSSSTEAAGTLCSQNGGRTCDGNGACKYCPVVDAQCTDIDPGEPNNATQAGAYDYGTISNDDAAGKHECGILKSGDVDWFTFVGYAPTIFGVDAYVTDPAVLVTSPVPIHACVYLDATTNEFGCPSGTTPDTAPNGKPGCCGTLNNNGFSVKSPDERRVWIKIEAQTTTTCAPYDLQFHD